ncbi:CHAD domain-containing protein [Streptomyces andamanensis]|uniref:CHAD domain-containing protein n=1 Tax=Streptomyces andamanensis TaxID=1565035 RepID=A0ABV8T9R9_9ACTN
MAQQHLDPTENPTAAGPPGGPAGPGGGTGADALAAYLRAQATEFLRALRLHREAGPAAGTGEEAAEAARALRRSARRISGSLHTFRGALDETWAEELRPELAWLSGTLAREHACQARLDRLLAALHRLSGPAGPAGPAGFPGAAAAGGGRADLAAASRSAAVPGGRTAPAASAASGAVGLQAAPAADRGSLTVGAAKAGALLDRQLTLARTRAHSTALQALGSSRFHAVADKVAVLASDVPLTPAAHTTDLRALAAAAEERLSDAVAALPLVTAGSPYNAEALIHGLSPDPAPHPQDAPWHQVRLLLRLHRYAQEALRGGLPADGRNSPDGTDSPDALDAPDAPDPGADGADAGAAADAGARLPAAGRALDRHRDASEAAAAAASAARTPRIAPATAYALGVLHADQRHEVEAARFVFQQSWPVRAVGAG